MAITLTALPALGATPIANGTGATLAADYFKLAPGALSSRDRKTISVISLFRELKANGGADYTANHAGAIQDAQVLTGGISQFNSEVAKAVTDWNDGKAADGTLSADVPTLLKEGRDLANLPEETLDRIITLLEYRLAV